MRENLEGPKFWHTFKDISYFRQRSVSKEHVIKEEEKHYFSTTQPVKGLLTQTHVDCQRVLSSHPKPEDHELFRNIHSNMDIKKYYDASFPMAKVPSQTRSARHPLA